MNGDAKAVEAVLVSFFVAQTLCAFLRVWRRSDAATAHSSPHVQSSQPISQTIGGIDVDWW